MATVTKKAMVNNGMVVCVVDAYGANGASLAIALRTAGCRVVHVNSRAEIPRLYEGTFQSELFDMDLIGANADTLASLVEAGVSSVVAGTEPGTATADLLAEALHLPGNPTATSHLKRNKYAMGEAVRAAGLLAVRQVRVGNMGEVRAVLRDWQDFPVVIKPVDSAATDCVFFCDDTSAAAHAASTVLGRVNCLGIRNKSVLIQEQLIGTQYIVNTFSNQGRHYITEIWRDDRYFIPGASTIYDREVLLAPDGETQRRLSTYAKDVLTALEVRNGPTHGEYMMTDRGPTLIELGARLQGNLNHVALERGLGASPLSHLVRYCMHSDAYEEEISRAHRVLETVVVVNLVAKRSGILTANQCMTLLPHLPSFLGMVGNKSVGVYLRKTVDLSSKPGNVYLVHKDTAQLEMDYRMIRAWEDADMLLTIHPTDGSEALAS